MIQLKQQLSLWITALALSIAFSGNAQAFVFQNLITFPDKTYAQDSSAGNHIDYQYEHSLADMPLNKASLESGSLTLEHFDNSNEGPRTEIWSILTEAGTPIGELGTSVPKKAEDSWILSQTVLEEIHNSVSSFFRFCLSELTAFNGEKITIYKSTLSLNYSLPDEKTPTVPEPETLLYLIAGLGCITPLTKRNFFTGKI